MAAEHLERAGSFDGLGRLRAGLEATTTTLGVVPEGDLAIAPPPAAFTGPPPVATPPPAPLQRSSFAGVVPGPGTWAVMIGINDYPGTGHDLQSAVSDANDVNDALAHLGVPGDHRLVLRDGQASATTIGAATDWLVAHAGPDAIAVFFYAGHVRKVDSETEALVGSDGRTFTDRELATRLAPLQAKRAWIGISACYGGGFTEVLAPGRILTAAADANHLAYENSSFHRSYLVEYMVHRAMLQDQANTSIQAAFAYARASLSRDYPQRMPVEYDSGGSDLDIRMGVVAPPPPPPPPKPKQSSPPQPTTPPSGDTGPSGGTAGDGQPRPPSDSCTNLSFGVVKCGSS